MGGKEIHVQGMASQGAIRSGHCQSALVHASYGHDRSSSPSFGGKKTKNKKKRAQD
uniref:Uncharacterized protein n=1 Tax=Setaria viridis TaxID=4556 RepID=A0A4U6VNY5_SETVI|nr:hypothetical protein SEVIR_2G035833v2 [Setaria viridis]